MKEALNVKTEEIQIKNQILSSGIDLNIAVTLMPPKQSSKDLIVQPRKKIELEKKREHKKASNKRKIKTIVISVISIIVVCISVILANNILFNNAICNQAKAENIKNDENNIPQFNGKQYLYIQNAPYSSITVKLPEYLKDKKFVDIYTVKENNNIEIYKKSVKTNENQTVTIETIEDAIGYAVIYIPLENLVVEQQNEKICINQNEPTEIKFKYIPENATSTHLKYVVTEEGITVNEENKLVGTKNGEYIVKVTDENNEVEKVINVNVVVPSNGDNPIEPVYIEGILIANKTYKLPKTYNPGLQPEVLKAFKKMKLDAEKEGLKLKSVSDFRSYDLQNELYKSYVASSGKETADKFSARPGYSEHQTGLAIDVNAAGDEFVNTPESTWLAQNAHKYGFIIRYPYGKESITGYQYEAWHIRYLGVETATKVYNSGLCLEEYLGITSEYQE